MWISGLKELKGLCQGCPIMPTQEFKQRRMLTGSGLFALLSRGFEQIFGQIVSIRMKTLSNTNMVASRLIKREKGSLPVDVRRSKTALLKLPNKVSFTLFAKTKPYLRVRQICLPSIKCKQYLTLQTTKKNFEKLLG